MSLSLLDNQTRVSPGAFFPQLGGGGGGGGSVTVSTIVASGSNVQVDVNMSTIAQFAPDVTYMSSSSIVLNASTIAGPVGSIPQSFSVPLPGALTVPAGGALAPACSFSTVSGCYYQIAFQETDYAIIPAGATPGATDSLGYEIAGTNVIANLISQLSSLKASGGPKGNSRVAVFEASGPNATLSALESASAVSTFVSYQGNAIVTKLT